MAQLERIVPKVKRKTKAQRARAVYADQPYEVRRSQSKSVGVQAPVVKREHKRRVEQLERDPAARKRLAGRQLRRISRAVPTAADLEVVPVKRKRSRLERLGDVAEGAVSGAASGLTRELLDALPALKASGALIDATLGTELLKNAPKDAAELAVTTPSSLAHLAQTAAKDPAKLPGLLAEPYLELARDPVGFVTERPVSTALMVQPAARLPGRGVGKVARLTGRQTLERPAATLPGSVLKAQRTGSRDYVVRRVQARQDARQGAPQMTAREVQRRADEFFDVQRQHAARVGDAARLQVKERGLTGDAAREHLSGARAGAAAQGERRFFEEFGSPWTVTDTGALIKPKGDAAPVLHATREAAQRVAERVPFEAVVREVGDSFGVVPKIAADRLAKHRAVGTSPAVGAVVMRTAGRTFRQAVLPTSMRWLFGQGAEAGLRSGVAGAGPISYVRGRKVVRKLEALEPGKGTELQQRAIGGGQFGLTGTAREFADGRSLADEFSDTGLARPAAALTKAGKAPGLTTVRRGWAHYTDFIFNVVNSGLEQTARTAMAGKAVKTGPLMERSLLGLSDRAITEAAQGLRATESQVQLGRQVDRMYGKYQKFSPGMRENLLHSTPFYPWYANVVAFLTKVLPVDHPVKTAIVADASALAEDWRKAQGLSLRGGEQVPSFLLGSLPTGEGQHTRVGRYTPFAPADAAGAVADLVFPQGMGPLEALKGIDFTGRPLQHPGGRPYTQAERVLAAGEQAVSAHVPGVGPAARVVRRIRDDGDTVPESLRREVDPLISTRKRKDRRTPSGRVVRVKPIVVKPVVVRRSP